MVELDRHFAEIRMVEQQGLRGQTTHEAIQRFGQTVTTVIRGICREMITN